MEQLKPCPFCGSNDVQVDMAYSDFRDTAIYCENCDMIFMLDDYKATEEQIVTAWNRRVDNG